MLAPWIATETSLFFSKKDPRDIRLGDCVQAQNDIPKETLVDLLLWAYPDHDGIQINGGRVGSAEAPEQIRRFFYKMTPHTQIAHKPRILDLGNINLDLPLAERHQRGLSRAQSATLSGLPWASLGGGHDYGYADGAGFLHAHVNSEKKPVIINFDAHLDVRPVDQGLSSGTPFFRLLNEFGRSFEFFEIGLQPHCNSQTHWLWAQSHGAHLISLDQVQKQGLQAIRDQLSPFQGHPLWISLDIDALCSSEAPGCSQSWTTGLKTTDLFDFMTWAMPAFSWKAFSIYEVSPPLDSDNRTSKLAAQFLHHYLSLQAPQPMISLDPLR